MPGPEEQYVVHLPAGTGQRVARLRGTLPPERFLAAALMQALDGMEAGTWAPPGAGGAGASLADIERATMAEAARQTPHRTGDGG